MFESGYYCMLGFSVWFWFYILCWDLVLDSGYYCVMEFSVWFWLLCVGIKCLVPFFIVCWDLHEVFGSGYYFKFVFTDCF